jgi:hypothetical protein
MSKLSLVLVNWVIQKPNGDLSHTHREFKPEEQHFASLVAAKLAQNPDTVSVDITLAYSGPKVLQ